MRFRTKAFLGAAGPFLGCLFAIALLAWGCTARTPQEKTPQEQEQAFYLEVLTGGGDNQSVAVYIPVPGDSVKPPDNAVNDWLAANPGRRITSLSGVLAYREGVSGFVAVSAPGAGGQRAYLVPTGYGGDKARQEPDARPVDAAAKSGAMAAFTAIPAYSGGVKEYLIVMDPAPK